MGDPSGYALWMTKGMSFRAKRRISQPTDKKQNPRHSERSDESPNPLTKNPTHVIQSEAMNLQTHKKNKTSKHRRSFGLRPLDDERNLKTKPTSFRAKRRISQPTDKKQNLEIKRTIGDPSGYALWMTKGTSKHNPRHSERSEESPNSQKTKP